MIGLNYLRFIFYIDQQTDQITVLKISAVYI